MLSPSQFEKYCRLQHQITSHARSYIDEARNSEPSRMVGTRAKNSVCSWLVSRKMGRTISTESRTAERAFITYCEFDDKVFEFWDQPPPIKLQRVDKNGKLRAGSYSPDFLVISDNGPEVIEVKTIEELEDKVVTQPENWKMLDDQEFEYVPALKSFAKIGLKHRVFAYRTDMRFEVANYQLLMNCRRSEGHDTSLVVEVDRAMEEAFCWSLYDLKRRLSLPSYAPLLQLIDRNYLFAKLKTSNLAEPTGCYVALSPDLLDQGSRLKNHSQIYVDGKLESTTISLIPRHSDAEKALEKLQRFKDKSAPERTLRRWRKLIDDGTKKGLSSFQCLLPKHYLKGNGQRKISASSESFLKQFLIEDFAQAQGLSIYRGYVKYSEAVESKALSFEPVTRKTFTRCLRQIPLSIIRAGRQGQRGENAAADATDPQKRALKAALPWQLCAIDHYKADVFVVCYLDRGTSFVLRPWISGMIDLATDKILALTVSLRDPSRVACAKVIRECVRKHRRLPNEIIVDRGSDFKSVFFSSLLAHYEITLSLRPSAHPRYGSEIEGLFGQFKKQWLSQRPGNLADNREARSVDGSKAPAQSAILNPFDLYRELQAFSAWRDAKPKGIEYASSAERFENGQDEYPFLGISVIDDAEFQLATSVETNEYTVDFQRGLHIGEQWYYSPLISRTRGKKSKLEVRRDPENPHVVYALIDALWEPCYSGHIARYASLDGAQQLQEGLIAMEGQNFRKKIKEQFDVDLARLVREMDVIRDSGGTPIIPVPISHPSGEEHDDFLSSLDLKNLRAVSVGGW